MNRILGGALAGLAATAPMTLAMELEHRRLPRHHRYVLPPREITERVVARAGLDQALEEEHHQWLTFASHFGYGAAAGAVYALGPLRAPLPPALTGPLFGLLVWAVSYLGVMPLLRLFPFAHEEPQRRNWLMVGAHLVWGGTLGVLVLALGADEPRAGAPSELIGPAWSRERASAAARVL